MGFVMALDHETKLYVKEIVEEAVADISGVCMERDQRMRAVEHKVFNGYGSSIKVLYGLYAVIIGLMVKLAFF